METSPTIPARSPDLLAALDRFDVVVGSRLVPGGTDARGAGRRIVTRLASAYVRAVLDVDLRDPTSGYRAIRASILDRVLALPHQEAGPGILQEVLVKATEAGARIGEIPIHFADRVRGSSTFGPSIAWASLRGMLRIRRARAGWGRQLSARAADGGARCEAAS